MQLFDNKKYEKCDIYDDTSVFDGYLGDYEIHVDILKKLSKDLGFNYDLYVSLSSMNKEAAAAMVKSMISINKNKEVVFLLDEENKVVLDYTLDTDRLPLLNSEFMKRILSLSETSDSIELSETYYHKDDKISSVILKKIDPITIEEKYENKDSNTINYDIGVLIVNDEVNASYSRLVLYVNDQPLYLPASYYNTTTSRYRRSTSNNAEALEVLVLKIIEDLREESLQSKIYDLHFKYRSNKDILASYEEYNTILRLMRRIPTIIEDNSFLEGLLAKYEEFEKKYFHLEDQRNSYIWRCTALSDIPLGVLISITTKILNDLSAPPMEYFSVRELLGNYISTNRIAEEIAKEDI